MHETGARSKREKRLLKPALQRRERLIFHHAGREWFRTERQKIAEANRAARQLDFAAEHGRGEIECRVSNKAARRDQWTVAQIERLSKTERVNEVRCLTEKLVVDRGAGDLDVTGGENQTPFVLLGKLARELNPIPELECRITVKVERQRREIVFKAEIGLEEKRIFVKDFAFVAALRNFDRRGDRPAESKQISIAILGADNSALVRPIAEREPELFALGFFGGDVEKKCVFIGDRSGLDPEQIEKAGPHQGANFFVHQLRAVSFAGELGKALAEETRAQSRQTVDKNFAAKAVDRAGGDGDVDRHTAVGRLLRRAGAPHSPLAAPPR